MSTSLSFLTFGPFSLSPSVSGGIKPDGSGSGSGSGSGGGAAALGSGLRPSPALRAGASHNFDAKWNMGGGGRVTVGALRAQRNPRPSADDLNRCATCPCRRVLSFLFLFLFLCLFLSCDQTLCVLLCVCRFRVAASAVGRNLQFVVDRNLYGGGGLQVKGLSKSLADQLGQQRQFSSSFVAVFRWHLTIPLFLLLLGFPFQRPCLQQLAPR